MIKLLAITMLVCWSFAFNVAADNPVPDTFYPNPVWNHLNETLFLRIGSDGQGYGLDEPDILYWAQTQNLLVEPSHSGALTALDDFINNRSERLITDPLKRALLQRDLWELFDWSAIFFFAGRASCERTPRASAPPGHCYSQVGAHYQ